MAKSLFTKILLTTFFILFVFFPVNSLAQSPDTSTDNTSSQLFIQKQDAIKNNTGLESWTNEAMSSNMISLFTGLIGEIPKELLEPDQNSTTFHYFPGGAVGNLNTMIASLHTPPASGIEYIAQVKDNFLGKPAYAQGIGFQGLQFLLPLWRGFRNMVYVFSTIIFLIIGIMIILRVKVSPQAVITIQSAVPQIITTLILVTFSYAIAGLVIDLANIIQAIVVAMLFSVKGVSLDSALFSDSWAINLISQLGANSDGITKIIDFIKQVISSVTSYVGGYSYNFDDLSNPNIPTIQHLTQRAVPGGFSLMLLGGTLGNIIGSVIGTSLTSGNTFINFLSKIGIRNATQAVGAIGGGLVGGMLIPLILTILVVIWLIKLFFGLVKNYVTIIFKIVLAPLEIATGAFPNSKMGFNTWILDLVSNIAVFPVVGIFLVLLNLIIDSLTWGVISSGSATAWTPGPLTTGTVSQLLGTPTLVISAAIGMAGLALLSKLPELVPDTIKSMKAPDFGKAIGESLNNTMFAKMGRSVSESAGKKFGDTVVQIGTKTGQAVLQRFGKGDKAVVIPENSGANIDPPPTT